ncbi:MAG: tetratricopeptide repeat protein [Steroidobacteraceae bacterium]
MDATQAFQLEELRIDPATGEIAGPGGREQLDPKVMGVLVFMAQRAGQVVSRKELLARLWPNAVVTDDVLTRCCYELRRQLSQAGGSERYKAMLETLPKRGYRLNAAATRSPSRPVVRPRTGSWRPWLALAITIPAAAAILALYFSQRPAPATSPVPMAAVAPSIAVLPFVDMSAAQDQAWLADGISEEILNRLAQSGSLRVIARTSSFSFRNRPVDIPEVAARLGVTHVLEGSVRRDGNHVRITAQLIEAATDSHAWSKTIDRELGDLFVVQDEIAASVATALNVALAGRPARRETPVSVAAHERFLQGEFFYNRRATGDIERAAKYYEEAVALDPGYARAWAALAGAYNLLGDQAGPTASNWKTRQGKAAHRAVELDPGLAAAHARLSQYYYETSDRERGDVQFHEALALDPEDSLVMGFAASNALLRGDVDGLLATWRKLVARDPLSATQQANFGSALFLAGQLDEALAAFRRVLELRPQGPTEFGRDEARVLVALRRYDEAESAIARLPLGERDFEIALLHDAPGRRAAADAALARLMARPGHAHDLRLAEILAWRGRRDEAFAVLAARRSAIERGEEPTPYRVWGYIEAMRWSYFLKPLHSDPRWTQLTAAPP